MQSILRYLITAIGATIFIVALMAVVPQQVISKEIPPAPAPIQETVYINYPTPPSWVPQKFITYVMQECSKQGVPYLLVFKLIERESEWKFSAKNINRDPKTNKIDSIDYGRFQINSLNFQHFIEIYKSPDRKASSYDLINNPYDNAEIGIKHLADLYSQFNNWNQAIQAYNGGAYRIKTHGPRASTVDYQQYIIPVDNWWEFPPHVVLVREGGSSN